MKSKIAGWVMASVVISGLMGPAMAADTIKIGFHAPLTGFAASDGKSATEGATLAVSQINAAGGVLGKPLELVVYDDEAKPAQAIPIANKLIGQDKVVAGISGSYSGATRSAAGIFQESKIPYISAYGIHPDITRAGEYVFRTSFLGHVQGKAGAKLLGEMMGKKKVVTITLQNDFGQSLAAGFAERREQGEMEIHHGIGIHSGPVLAGNVGSVKRKTYSLLGDTVNLASRLQVLNKQLATDILLSGETRNRLVLSDTLLQPMGQHTVKGKTEPVVVYAVV